MKLNHNFKEWIVFDEVMGLMLNTAFRFLVAYGGRGGGKSHFVAEMLILIGTQSNKKILCVREFQNSIDDSVMSLLMAKAEKLCPDFYIVRNNKIIGKNGTTFIFIGLARNIGSIKSLEGIDIVWGEEVQYFSYKGWELLEPTIRKAGSQIILTMNRDSEQSVIDKTFIQNTPPPRTIVTKVNYTDNPFDIPILEETAEHCKKNDYGLYQHIWLGELNKLAKEQVLFGKWRTDIFTTPSDVTYYIGADWSNGGADPHTLVSCYIRDNTLYIDNEMVVSGQVSFDTLEEHWKAFHPLSNGEQWTVRCDEANSINTREMKRRGFRAKSAPKKWAGVKSSVQAGINYLRNFNEIVIHERCKETIKEAKYYRWKTDKDSGEIVPILLDGNDHIMSAIRYAMVKNIMKFRQ